MNKTDYSVTFACYNQAGYTRKCVDSLLRHGFELDRLVVVDNGSTDDTRDYLQTLPLGGRIFNQKNLGCGVAWNQGALALQAEWTVVMNNDVLVSAGWLENMLGAASRQGLKLVSPAMVEGPLDYDFDTFSVDAARRMDGVARAGGRHAVCMAIHRSVWDEIGYFQPVPKLWGYEDTLFFNEIDKAAIPTAMLGCAWLHHYGSITLTALKQERGLSGKQGLSARTSYRLLGQSTLRRKLAKFNRVRQLDEWRRRELAEHGMTLHGQRENGTFRWQ